MLPSTASSSAPTNSPASAPVFAPVATGAPTVPGGASHHQLSASTTTTATACGGDGATALGHPPATTVELGARPLPQEPSHCKRGPSPSLDGQSTDSSASLLGCRDNVSAVPEDQRTKKRRTGAGARNVANLTPEQLAKKRANDREAQRAIRERTKHQIEALESRIRELTAQKPFQELQKVIRQKEEVEAKNVELRTHLTSIMSSIQHMLSGGSVAAEGGFALPLSPYSNPTQPTQSIPSPNSGGHHVKKSNQQQCDGVPSFNIGGEHIKLGFVLDPSHKLERLETGVNGAQDSPAYRHLPMKHDWSACDRTTSADGISPLPLLSPTQQHQQHQCAEHAPDPSNAPHSPWMSAEIPIPHVPSTSVIDDLLLNFMKERRQRFAEGIPAQEVVGPKYPSVSSLLNPEKATYSHPLSKFFTDIMSKFSALCTLPERVAILYVTFRIMRWHISPTQENWDLLPSFLRPLEMQFSIPHPAWIDYIPWPKMREKFIHEYDSPHFNFNEIFIPYTQALSLNWPYEDRLVLLEVPDTEEIIIDPVFKSHLLNLENWSLGDKFDKACPFLRGTYKLKSERNALSQENAMESVNDTHQAD
ncbi:hypothetical protein NUW58_g7536 [Xylaria curta]|uniref:Uncharacterized protein n=1 Tax=Xylaria curta TaxID=42375 RepID=A0ACC1NGB0_9PEZI|nr:hypothetical protein NUW58_g7536 [Xylaria curta]